MKSRSATVLDRTALSDALVVNRAGIGSRNSVDYPIGAEVISPDVALNVTGIRAGIISWIKVQSVRTNTTIIDLTADTADPTLTRTRATNEGIASMFCAYIIIIRFGTLCIRRVQQKQANHGQ